MNEETTQLLKELTDKLGTTTEHLWGVLVTQAPISATTDLVSGIAFLAVFFALIFVGMRKFEKYENEVVPVISGIIGGFGLIINFICFLQNISMMMAGFFNPEYWALKQLL